MTSSRTAGFSALGAGSMSLAPSMSVRFADEQVTMVTEAVQE
jgi:hypothetical protein